MVFSFYRERKIYYMCDGYCGVFANDLPSSFFFSPCLFLLRENALREEQRKGFAYLVWSVGLSRMGHAV
jgi:hypothetical protein